MAGEKRHTSSALPLMGLDNEHISQVCVSQTQDPLQTLMP